MLLGSTAYTQIIHIPEDYPSIQSGIDSAGNGDTILVAEGRYYENINFKGKAITVASRFILGRDTSYITGTIIDGSRPCNPDTASTVLMVSGEDSTSVLCGFTITGGRGSITRIHSMSDRAGVGIFIDQSGGKIQRNIIQNNNIQGKSGNIIAGGGLFVRLSNTDYLHFICSNNYIRSNTLIFNRGIQGAGLTLEKRKGNILVRGNLITNNQVISRGRGSVHAAGMSIRFHVPCEGPFIVRDNNISENWLEGYPSSPNPISGAGILVVIIESENVPIDFSPYPLIYNNTIRQNYTNGRGGGIAVGGYYNRQQKYIMGPKPLIIKNTIIDNKALDGAGILNSNFILLLADNTIRNDLSEKECNEILNMGNGAIYTSNNEYQGEWKGRKTIRLGDRLFMKSEGGYLRIKGMKMKRPLEIATLPPLWRIWWALPIYGISIVLLFLWYRNSLVRRERMKTALEIERIEKEKAQEIDQLKSRFFANISHEFRTPLTLLLGPIEDLLKQKPREAKMEREVIQLMRNNVLRLQRLINQLLDLSKLESGKMKLVVKDGDLTSFVRRIVLSFLSLAESKKIRYEYDLPEIPFTIYFDGDKLEKILTNLISNAFKFTPEEGQISVTLRYIYMDDMNHPMKIELKVRDTGKGIPGDQIEKIYNRFYQVSSLDAREGEGTGIGLSLTKELVEVYRGEIKVESEPDEGSEFIVVLPVMKEEFSEDEIALTTSIEKVLKKPDDPRPVFIGSAKGETLQNRKPVENGAVVLIVEDNIELRNYIAQNLSTSYQLLEAENGRIGLEKAIKFIPDLVISDLMMPQMDGLKMCKRLKSDERTSHIPVIILTAKADRESKLDGLETGADDYIIKPFDVEELLIRVNNLITLRSKLRKRYRKEFLTDSDDLKMAAPEEEFLSKVMKCLERNVSDSEFTVDKLGSELSLSRVQLYRKIISLTDYSPQELIRNIRLKLAARMFQAGHNNISRIMYEVGFSTPSYFARCFRDLYGLNPSDYIKQIPSI